jgi:hypothetical protein
MAMRAGLMAAAATVLPALACAAGVTVSVDTSKPGAVLTSRILGANMANWYDVTQSGLSTSLRSMHMFVLRWPGGSASDTFHWQTNSACNGGYVSPNSTFDAFMTDVAQPGADDVGVTLNYGSNAACNAGGDPTEAAAWVAYAKQKAYKVTHWTVGNEVYGSWEYDLHSAPHDPTTYANAVATGYYPDIKKANPGALVGVVVNPGNSPAWDPIVLSTAKYDFVEYHYYAQAPGQESDAYLVAGAAQDFAKAIAAVAADLKSAGHASTPIYVGELGSVYSNPGKQTSSITQALFAGQVIGEMMNAGIARATWWLGYGGCADAGSGNFSSSLYGWQSFGGYMLFSDGLPEYGCSSAPSLARGVPLPTARAFQVMSLIARSGEHALPASVSGAGVRAYAATQGTGTAVALFNTSETTSATVTLSVGNQALSGSVVETVYDKAIYDRSKAGVWAGPVSAKLGALSLPLRLTLNPWSITVLQVAQ